MNKRIKNHPRILTVGIPKKKGDSYIVIMQGAVEQDVIETRIRTMGKNGQLLKKPVKEDVVVGKKRVSGIVHAEVKRRKSMRRLGVAI